MPTTTFQLVVENNEVFLETPYSGLNTLSSLSCSSQRAVSDLKQLWYYFSFKYLVFLNWELVILHALS